mmetsp:Transcript_3635/g.9049  ORF Transcript_3635/g.9049 Transcript_3635/m.9049 type:complete len:218 (-) Transcript_3635:616-1269(-)
MGCPPACSTATRSCRPRQRAFRRAALSSAVSSKPCSRTTQCLACMGTWLSLTAPSASLSTLFQQRGPRPPAVTCGPTSISKLSIKSTPRRPTRTCGHTTAPTPSSTVSSPTTAAAPPTSTRDGPNGLRWWCMPPRTVGPRSVFTPPQFRRCPTDLPSILRPTTLTKMRCRSRSMPRRRCRCTSACRVGQWAPPSTGSRMALKTGPCTNSRALLAKTW